MSEAPRSGPGATADVAPRGGGRRWPAEWERHRATWLAWPHKEASWPGRFEHIPAIFVEMVRALVAGERVEILVRDDTDAASVGALLEAARVNETQLAERATGYYWGEPQLRPFVERMLAEAERAGDERLEQVARRFLR